MMASRGVLATEERCRRFGDTISKLTGSTLCMPIPTDRELEELRVLAFPRVSPEVFKLRLDNWGPIPQFLFELNELGATSMGMLRRSANGTATYVPRRIPLQRALGEQGGGDNIPLPFDDYRYFFPDEKRYFTPGPAPPCSPSNYFKC